MDKKLIARFIVRALMGTPFLGVALFWPSGWQMGWWAAWALLAVMLAWAAATLAVILRFHPPLLAERLGPRKGAKPWDTAIMGVVGLAQVAWLVIAGFDRRYGWTSSIPCAAQIAALIVIILGYALVVWATAANAFFSQFVRIQSERGHAVAAGGPYRTVRHPAYVGTILTALAAPILLTSWWALIPGAIGAVAFVIRTALEDRILQAELAGYADYARQVRYRLLPGIW